MTGGDTVFTFLLYGFVAALAILASVRKEAEEIGQERVPAWSGRNPLPAPHHCPTSTKVEAHSGGMELITLDDGWARGHGTTYAWTAGIRLPPEALGAVQLRVVLVNRHGEHLPAGDGMGNFFADARQVRDEQVEDLVRILRERLAPEDAEQLAFVTALAPIDRLPGGKPGTLKRARARLEITTSEGRRLTVTTPFAYVPRVAPEDRIEFQDVTADETACPVCGDELAGRKQKSCKRCGTPHHADCWAYLGECAIFGCHA